MSRRQGRGGVVVGPSGPRIPHWVGAVVGVGRVADRCIRRDIELGEAAGPTKW